MPGNTGDTKHTVLIPASYICFIAAILRSMETAASISSLNFSSSVLIDHDTVTCRALLGQYLSPQGRILCESEYLLRSPQLFKAVSLCFELFFLRIIPVCHGSDHNALSGIFLRVLDFRPVLDIKKCSPLFPYVL